MTFTDLKTRISLRSEEKMADTMQAYESLALVVSAALGGSKGSEPKADPATAPKTADELEARLARMLG